MFGAQSYIWVPGVMLQVGYLLALLLLHCLAQHSSAPARVLVYTATRRYRHDSIPTAIAALMVQGPSNNMLFDNTEDQAQFNDSVLSAYDVLLFLHTTGEVLDESGKAAFQRYLDLGGNFVGVHAASDCMVNTTFYEEELGAHFDYHPDIQNATIDVIGPSHLSTSMLPTQWHVQDEMYNFKSDPRAVGAVVVLSADESSYNDPGPRKYNQGSPHPTAWFQEHGAGVESGGIAGRSFYTSLGHLNETWQVNSVSYDDLFIAHVISGITWVLQANTTRAFNSSAQVGNSGASASDLPSSLPSGSPPPTSPSSAGIPTTFLTGLVIIASLSCILTAS